MDALAKIGNSPREAELIAELRASKEFMNKVLNGLNDHYVIFDHDWRYIYVNDAATRTLGLPKDKLIGSVIWELFPHAVGNQFYRELHHARTTGEDIVFEHYYQEWDMWFENRIYTMPDWIAVLSIDITARKRGEEAQRQSEQMLALESSERKEGEERLQVIYQLSEAVNRAEAVEQIYELALSGLERVLHVHRASILLFDQKGVMRIQAWRGLSEQYRAAIDGQFPRFINYANPIPVLIPDVAHADLGVQQQIHLEEGIYAIAFIPLIEQQRLIGKFMLYYEQPHAFGEAEVQWAQTIARHVAHALERKQAEEALRQLNATLEQRVYERTMELERSNRELDQFAYVASHDLKAPLRAINHLSSWVSQDAAHLLPAASQEHLNKLQGRVRRMETLLDDLLAYSRAGRQRHPAELVDITDLIHNVTDIIAPPAGFAIKIVSHLPVLQIERAPLETVFRNLIGNAIKHHHNPSTGVVEISAHESGQENFVEFIVKDNGPGIDPIFHQRIFEMFQTLQPRDEVEGSGVGLAVVKRSVESRGGTIKVESKVGDGAIFCFTWPKTVAQHTGSI